MITGGYVLHLYCDNPTPTALLELGGDEKVNKFNHGKCWEYGGQEGRDARRQARKEGWKLNLQDGIAYCPYCTGRDR